MEMQDSPTSSPHNSSDGYWREWVILLIALAATAGSIFLSVGMKPKLAACPLCFYQRSFVMAIVVILIVGLLRHRSVPSGSMLFLCIPLAVGGLGVAAFHVYLERSGVLVCPYGILKVGTAPQQSLAAYVLLTVTLLIFVARHSSAAKALLGTVGLGIVVTLLSIWSAPDLPKPKPEDADLTSDKVTVCKPVYRRLDD